MRRAFVLLLLIALPAAPATAQADVEEDALARALDWLATQTPSTNHVPYFVEAAAFAGKDPKSWPSAEDPIFARLAPYAGSDGEYYSHTRVAHAAAVSGYDPRSVNGRDHVALVRAGAVAGQSGSATFVNDDIWAILALRSAGIAADDEQIRGSVRAIRARQLPDGGWSHTVSGLRGNTDITGAALAALKAAGEDMHDFAGSRAFLDATRNVEGAHNDNLGIGPNCQSTVWALHGYAALGHAARRESLDFLRGLQRDDGGFATSASAGSSNAWCTTEAVVALSGARFPLPGHEATSPVTPACHAREVCAIGARAPFRDVDIAWDDGVRGARSFDAAGTYHYRYHASGPGLTARGEGNLTVLSARPQLGAFPANVTLARHAPLALDLRNASDPDGRIVAFEVDWGDGTAVSVTSEDPDAPAGASRNVTNVTTHAYDRPGSYHVWVRAQDDAGVWSLPGGFDALVVNRAPSLGLPARLVADRILFTNVNVTTSDPEGDALAIAWRIGNASGLGAPRFLASTLGNQTLEVTLTDAYGAVARANATVEVVNLPPILTIDASRPEREITAVASDPDGPTPTLAWTLDGAPVQPPLRLSQGKHTVRVVATDADGALSEAMAQVDLGAPDETGADPIAPVVTRFEARLDAAGTLETTWALEPTGATVRLFLRSDAGESERTLDASPFVLALPGATWASVALVAEHDGLSARRDSGLLTPPAPPVAPAPRAAAPAQVIIETRAPAPADEPTLVEAPLDPASVTRQAPGRQDVPAASWALGALVAAMLARRARSA